MFHTYIQYTNSHSSSCLTRKINFEMASSINGAGKTGKIHVKE